MFLWFLGTSVLAVWFVFRDEQFDYRLLCVGAVAPDLIDVWWGGARVLHSVVTSIVVLLIVMLSTFNRRVIRRRTLAFPIGLFLHLVFDGAFGNTRIFWWPLAGLSFQDARLPTAQRGALNFILEAAGLCMVLYVWKRFHLLDARRRRLFIETGQLHDGATGNAGTC